jgi:hypothetical protein
MLAKLQPTAMAFNGCVVKGGPQNKSTCITPNALRWIGTEAGVAPDPTWSTGFEKGGDPCVFLVDFSSCPITTTLIPHPSTFFKCVSRGGAG